MSLAGSAHQSLVFPRRIRRLRDHLLPLLQGQPSVLDVGCGDGTLAESLSVALGSATISGVDVLVREDAKIPVKWFDGSKLPFPDKSFDAVLFVDVLHHTANKEFLLREAARVSRSKVVIKDHLLNGWLAFQTLSFMDYVGNKHHGVALPYLYWSESEWQRAFSDAGLRVNFFNTRLELYPFPASLMFDRGLHFVAELLV